MMMLGAALLPLVAAALAGTRRRDMWPAFAGIAAGLSSLLWMALLMAGIRTRGTLIAVDVVAWGMATGVAAVVVVRGRGERPAGAAMQPDATRDWAPAAMLLLLAGAVAATGFAASSVVNPHGEWDAWAQWNLRARFFFRGLPDAWRNAFDPVLAWSHADYPPLVSALVARFWTFGGRDTVLVPILVAALFALGTVALAGLSVGRAAGRARGCLAAAAILACPLFVRFGPSQCADVPLGFYMVAAFACLARALEPSGRWSDWTLAGVAMGLAAWTKNEGLAFCLVVAGGCAIERGWSTGWRGLRALVPLAAGAVPVLLTVAWFKHALAPPSYFVAEQTFSEAMASLFDAGRLHAVWMALAREVWFNGGSIVGVLPIVTAFVLLRGVRRPANPAAWIAGPAMIVMLGIYALAYLVTPKDLAWQLQTSVDRVVLQLVPTFVWACMMIAR